MQIAVLSDIHDRLDHLERVMAAVNARGVERVFFWVMVVRHLYSTIWRSVLRVRLTVSLATTMATGFYCAGWRRGIRR